MGVDVRFFRVAGKPILISEYFLPALLKKK